MARDIRNTIRVWRLNPGTTIASYLALTVGIGAASSIFSIINSVLIAPLPVSDAEHVVRVTALDRNNNASRLSLPDALDLKQRIHLADSFAFYRDRNGNLGSVPSPLLVHMLEIDSALFQVLDVKMAQGHAFTAAANQPGHACEAVISWPLWQSRFNGATVTDQDIRLNEKPCRIAGVLPRNLDIPVDADIWVPKIFDLGLAANGRGFHSLYGMARLRRDATVTGFNAELNRLSDELTRENPAVDSGLRLRAVPLREVLNADVKSPVLILFAAVTGVLLMACANVANLLLARTSARLQEFSLRIAIGASRISLLQQMLTESMLLALMSSLSGLALSVLFVRWIRSLPDSTIPRPESVLIDWRVMLFALLMACLTGLFFGVLPVLKVSHSSVIGVLSQASRMTEGNRQRLARNILVASETALATLLLIASLLLLRSFSEISKLNPGFQTDHLLTAYVSMNPMRYRYTADSARLARKVIATLKNRPGIVAVTFTTSVPLQGGTSGSGPVEIEGHPEPQDAASDKRVINTGVSPGFRQTLRIPLKAGADLTEQDDGEETTATLVNSMFAKTYFPNENALGKRIRYAAVVNSGAPWLTITGIIGDTRQMGPEATVRPEIYQPLSRSTGNILGVVIRTADNPAAHLHDLEMAVQQADAELPVFYPRTMEQVEGRRLGTRTLITKLLGGLAGIAWLLAFGGIFAVMGYSVSLRTSEIGVRMAVGATRGDVVRIILIQGLTPAFAGVAAGLAAALVLTRYLAALLYGIQSDDPVSYAGTVVLLGGAAVLAAWLPAHRAAAVEPWHALRRQ